MSTKYILAGGYLHKSEDGGKAFCEEMVKGFNHKPVKILDCMFARPRDSWEEKMQEDKILFSNFVKDFELELAIPEKFVEQVKESDVVFIRGGYNDLLNEVLSTCPDWVNYIDGKKLVGTSAGAALFSKYYYEIDRTMVDSGLGLVPVKLICHWKSDYKDLNNNEIDWDKIHLELKNYKEDMELLLLTEGEFKVFEK